MRAGARLQSRNAARVPAAPGHVPPQTEGMPLCRATHSVARALLGADTEDQMSMRMSISQAAVAVLAGCGVATTTEYTAADQTALAAAAITPGECPRGADCFIGTCPTPKDCTHPNGPGIFFEEKGSVG